MNYNFKAHSKIIVTGGSGFIGTNLIIKLLKETQLIIFNIDKLGYASNNFAIDSFLESSKSSIKERYKFIKLNLCEKLKISNLLKEINPDLVIHLAAESHVDRSIKNPQDFLDSNIIGTFNLLDACLANYKNMNINRKKNFRFLHVSTDEVFGSLSSNGYFSENSKYDPRSPYSASKAASDHLVKAWFHTYDLPILITNCGNNYGPWQFPEKLIPTVITNAYSLKEIPIYGNGLNIRDWIYVEDHINAILLALSIGKIGENYCIGSKQELTNLDIAKKICSLLDQLKPQKFYYKDLITFISDRPGHDKRYAINPDKIATQLGWKPLYNFHDSLSITINWYLENIDWCINVLKKEN